IVTIGLMVTIGMNLAFSLQTSLWVMLILWGINGFAQSTGWSPMLRIIAERFDVAETKRISTIMPFSYVVGTAVTWSLIGVLTANGQWRIAFFLPAIFLTGILIFWWLSGIDAPRSGATHFRMGDATSEIRLLWQVLLAAGLVGFIHAGSLLWLPSYVEDTTTISATLIGFAAAIMQVIALGGLFLAQQLVNRTGRVITTTAGLLIATSIALLVAILSAGTLALLFVTVALIVVNGAIGLVVSSVPIVLAGKGRTSSVTGLVNTLSSVGGGVAGFGLGWILDRSGWNPALMTWAMCALVASLLLFSKRRLEPTRAISTNTGKG
ncbi:MAG: MFS transporter, partial [Chloroflexota bacterium]